jgi:hypothetical protein
MPQKRRCSRRAARFRPLHRAAPLRLRLQARSRAAARASARRAARGAARGAARLTPLPPPPRAQFHETADLAGAGFGEHCFKGAVAGRYLAKHGESAALLATAAWMTSKSDVVAAAILDWARDNGASVFCHWFQPMGSSGFRHGQTGQVYNTMIEFNADGVAEWKARGAARVRGRDARAAPAAR